MQDTYKIPLATALNLRTNKKKTNRFYTKWEKGLRKWFIRRTSLPSCVFLCPVSPPGPNADRLWRPGRWARSIVTRQPEQTGQSQRGGDERSGSPLLHRRPGHLAQSAHRLPQGAVKLFAVILNYTVAHKWLRGATQINTLFIHETFRPQTSSCMTWF